MGVPVADVARAVLGLTRLHPARMPDFEHALGEELRPVDLPASIHRDVLVFEACDDIVGAFTLVGVRLERALCPKLIEFSFVI